MSGTIWSGLAVLAGIVAIGWALARWGKWGALAMAIVVIAIGGALVRPIHNVAAAAVDTIQAPLNAIEALINKKWR